MKRERTCQTHSVWNGARAVVTAGDFSSLDTHEQRMEFSRFDTARRWQSVTGSSQHFFFEFVLVEDTHKGGPGRLTPPRWAGWSGVQVGRHVKC